MVSVTLVGNLKLYTGGVTDLEVEADNIRQLLLNLRSVFCGDDSASYYGTSSDRPRRAHASS